MVALVLLTEAGREMVAPDRKLSDPPWTRVGLLSVEPERNSTVPSVRSEPGPMIVLPFRSLFEVLSLKLAPEAIEKSPA